MGGKIKTQSHIPLELMTLLIFMRNRTGHRGYKLAEADSLQKDV